MELAQLDFRPETSALARGHMMTRAELERDLLSLYEQLLATRFELTDSAGPADGSLNLSPGELDCVLVQLDSAIVAARSMVSSAVRTPCESENHTHSATEQRAAGGRQRAVDARFDAGRLHLARSHA